MVDSDYRRRNLTVVTRTRASRLVFDGDRVVGVWASKGAQPVEYRARKEVIVSARTIESPLLLERSGIGNPDDALRYALETGSGIAHAVGACAIGPKSDDVVDPQLRIRGVDGLRVVDASVLPVQVAGNSQAPAIAVAWIAADLILEGS
jgi:choline dehydrogenase-like flavoprotein